MRLWLPILILTIGALALSETYWGDPLIYLCFAQNGGFEFNPGHFSSGATSPLWVIFLRLGEFKFVSYLSVVAAMIAFDRLRPWGAWAVFTGAFFGLLGYETGLMFTLLALFLSGWVWLLPLLPFVRPELVVIPLLLFAAKRKYTYLFSLLPFGLYVAYSALVEPFPLVSVFGRVVFEARYLLVLVPFAVYYLKGSPLWMSFAVVFAFYVVTESVKGYDFDTLTERSAAEYLNEVADSGATVKTHEVQIRCWLRKDLYVSSDDGITDGKPLETADYLILNAQKPLETHGYRLLKVNPVEPPIGVWGWREIYGRTHP